jgi:aryl-phospho-beta-D-glucosidase BglC (GH1 family)
MVEGNCQTTTEVQNYLTVSGNKIIDKRGETVFLTGINWFGFETSLMYPHGIWSRDTKSVLQQIKDLGFNTIRIPFCTKMLDSDSTISVSSYGTDSYTGTSPMNEEESAVTTPIELLDIIIDWCQDNDMKVILDNHSKEPDGYITEGLWYTDDYDEARWISDWVFLANRYKGKSAMVGCDLKNEFHDTATWGDSNELTDVNKASERCGDAILAENPDLLIFVEGVEEYNGETSWWGGMLKGAADYPVVLTDNNQLVYSPHEYGPEVFDQEWFSDETYPDNLEGIWDDHFGFLYNEGTAPIFVGEFGIKDQDADDGKAYVWFETFTAYMNGKHHWTYWCMNPNSGDTGGILQDDWVSVNQWKMDVLTPYLAEEIPNVITTTTTLGVNDYTVTENEIKIYPNPSNDVVSIELPDSAGITTISINDITGKVVLEESISSGVTNYTLDISSITSGVYIVNFKSDATVWSKKLIKE